MKLFIFGVYVIILTLIAFPVFAQDGMVSSDSNVTREFLSASLKFIGKDYEGSIPLYNAVLRRDTLLTRDYWHVLIDNLGMAYGITGDMESAEQIFHYGLSKDSTYPLFYYNLACAYAERNDLDSCMTSLRIAYKFRKNTIKGESLPDPGSDDSFQKFMKNKKFLSALKRLKKQ